jgi:amino acid transporter
MLPPANVQAWGMVLAGAMLAFYAFLGFEDMVVIAEEVKDVRRILPLAIVATLALTTLLYLLVMTVAVLAIPPAELAASKAPLAMLYEKGAAASPLPINVIATVAIINGALIQIIMASRLLYGLASKRQIPAVLAYVHPWTRTPLVATLAVALLILVLALPGTLKGLAEATSLVMLVVFALVNLSAWRVKRSMPARRGLPLVPQWVPLLASVVTLALVVRELVVRLAT